MGFFNRAFRFIEAIRFIGLPIILACLLSLTAGCGGGGGDSAAPVPVVGNIEILEKAAKAKAQNVFPPAEYAIFEAKLGAVSKDPSYEGILTKMNLALDNFNNAEASAPGAAGSVKQAVEQMRTQYTGILGDITHEAQAAFLNAGIGWSRSALGGAAGSLQAKTGGVEGKISVNFKGGSGQEITYDFLNFSKADINLTQCTAAGGVSLDAGAASGLLPGVDLDSLLTEKWIFGFEKGDSHKGGPSAGLQGPGGITRLLGSGLGIADAFGIWNSVNASCSPLACPATVSLDPGRKYGMWYAVGGTVSGKPMFGVGGGLGGAGSSNCMSEATGSANFTDASLPEEIRYLQAGIATAADLLTSSNTSGAGVGFRNPAAATALLYGVYYNALLINPPDTIKPTVSVLSPINNDILTGNIIIQVSSSDNTAVSEIRVWTADAGFADNRIFEGNSRTETINFVWNSTGYPAGAKQTIYARAYDLSGNFAETSVDIIVGPVGKYAVSRHAAKAPSFISMMSTQKSACLKQANAAGRYPFAGHFIRRPS